MHNITITSINRFFAALRLCASIFLISVALGCSVLGAEQPNIVLVFIDDMGYGDIGPFGSEINQTPSLDRMAREGNVLRQFYVSNTACTPSRSALMTGTYAHRIGMDGSVVFPGEKRGLNPKEITIAEMLKEHGYATGCFGKWHLGDQPEFLPLKQGFDEYFGIPYSNDMWPGNKRGNPVTNRGPYEPLPVMRGNEAVAYVSDGADQSLLCKVVTDEAIKFIEAHKDEPFFCYVPHAYIHNPRFARPEILQRAEGDTRRANIEEVDDSVGRILAVLRELKLAENTLVMFTSDNGGAEIGPLRGAKGGPKYEGHMREPTLTWWPGTIPGGVETEAIATTTDLLPSFAKLTGAKVPTDRTIDGKDVLDILLAKPDATSPHEILYYETDGIRRGDWKLVRVTVKGRGRVSELYNLKDEVGERNNLAAKHPDIVAELEKLLTAHAERIVADTRPAGFVEDAKPILTEPGKLPRLRDFMGLPGTNVGEASVPQSHPKPASNAAADGGARSTTNTAQPSSPNIILILTDDTGWNGLSIPADPEIPGSGSRFYQTPNTDKLALSGIRFSMAYSPSPTCGPSRTSIQYGLTPSTVGKFAEEVPRHLPPVGDAMVIRLKAAFPQYRAAHFGKWHQRTRTPEEIGYDESDGQTMNHQTEDPKDPKFTSSLAKKTKDFITRQVKAETPFFVQVSFYANHLKYDALPETIEKYKARADKATEYQKDPVWAAMNEELDMGVGTILDRLDDLGIRDNTYIIYTADNGFECKRDGGKPVKERQFYKAHPIRSHKYMISEGGLRVPFIVSGPGIPAGASSREPVVGWDIMPTVLEMAGAKAQIPDAVEGGSLLAHCKSGGKDKVNRRDPFMVFRYTKKANRRDIAIVQDGYKLLRELDSGGEHLFSLWDDLGESKNLLAKMPERADQLRENMDDYFAAIGWDQDEHEGYRAEHMARRKANKEKKYLKKKEKAK